MATYTHWLKLSIFLIFTFIFSNTLQAVEIILDGTISKETLKSDGSPSDGNLKTCKAGDVFRLGNSELFKGQAFDILLTVTAEENEADTLTEYNAIFTERPCIGVANGLIETILRDRIDEDGVNDPDSVAFMDFELTAVKEGTKDTLLVDSLQFTAFDLDRNGDHTLSDDIYISTPGKASIDTNDINISLIQIISGDYGNGYDIKMEGNRDILKPEPNPYPSGGNCRDTANNPQPECRASATIEISNTTKKLRLRVANDHAFGSNPSGADLTLTSANDKLKYRLIQISLQESVIVGDGVDHGDAQESYGDARHYIDRNLTLGVSYADGEIAQYSANADIDDVDNSDLNLTDDEDAVSIVDVDSNGSIFRMTQGRDYEFNIITKGTGYLSAWMDYDINDSFGTDEKVENIDDVHVTSETPVNRTFSARIPTTAKTGKSYVRFRLSKNAGIDASGFGGNGEVEDYVLFIDPSGTVIGVVYDDKNGNGIQDAGELGFPNVKVTIIAKNGEVTLGTTDVNGNYSIAAVAVGTASVSIDENDLPAGATKTTGTTNPTDVTVSENVDSEETKHGYQLQANLVTEKSVDKATPKEGEVVTFTLTVENSGPSAATNVSLTDKLPAGLTYESHTGGDYDDSTGIWNIGEVNNGETKTLEIKASVDQGTTGQKITNITTAASTPDQNDDTPDGDDLEETVTVGVAPKFTISDASAREDQGPLVFDINLSETSNFPTIIKLTIEHVTTDTSDITTVTPITVTIPANTLGITQAIAINNDGTVEPTETFKLKGEITSISGNGEKTEGTGTILDDDTPNQVLSINDVTASEESGKMTFTVKLALPSSEPTIVTLNTEDNPDTVDANVSAEAGKDYVALNDVTITIPAGETSMTIDINVTDDDIAELDETFLLKGEITSALGNTKKAEGTGTITDEADRNALIPSVSNTSIDENSTDSMKFVVSISIKSSIDTILNITLEDNGDDGTLDNGKTSSADHSDPSPITVTIVAGELTASEKVEVSPTADTVLENDESFDLKATIVSEISKDKVGTGTGIIRDDKKEALKISNASAKEGIDDLIFILTLNAVSASETKIKLDVENIDTTVEDYGKLFNSDGSEIVDDMVTIPANTKSIPVTLKVLLDNNYSEPAEELYLNGEIVEGDFSTYKTRGLGTITEGPVPDLLMISNVTQNEDAGKMTFTVSLSTTSAEPTEITLKLRDGSAKEGVNKDYHTLSETSIVIPANQTEYNVTVEIVNDDTSEATESFFLDGLITAPNVFAGQRETGEGTILDDGTTTITITPQSGDDGVEEGNDLVFDIKLSNPSSTDTVIELNTANGTAIAPGDYTSKTETITIGAGNTTATFTVNTNDDLDFETLKENMTVTGKVGTVTVSGTGTIVDNDVDVNDDNATGEVGQPVTIDVLDNDEVGLNPTTVRLVGINDDPVTKLEVPGEGTWTVDELTGKITFTPEDGYKGDPTPVDYTVKDAAGFESPTASIGINYRQVPEANDDNETAEIGDSVEIDVLSNDKSTSGDDLNVSSVRIIDPETNASVTELVVEGEGKWEVDTTTGKITFTPLDGFTGDPTPISYTVADIEGTVSDPAKVTVDYLQAVEANDDTAEGEIGSPVTINVLENDKVTAPNTLNPTSVKIVDEDGTRVTELEVPNEGTWEVNPTTGAITFTPEDGFTGDPTPISYTVKDNEGTESEPASVTVTYASEAPKANDDNESASVGDNVEVNILANDTDEDGDINKSTVSLVIPDGIEGIIATDTDNDGDIDKMVVPSEGTWTVDENGIVKFVPQAGFTGDPTPIRYTVNDETGFGSNEASVSIDVDQNLVDDTGSAFIGDAISLEILSNDDMVYAHTVSLIGAADDTPDYRDGYINKITVPDEGIWTVDILGVLTFTPESGFTGNPTPIKYTAKDSSGNVIDAAKVTVTYSARPVVPPVVIFVGVPQPAAPEPDVELAGPEANDDNLTVSDYLTYTSDVSVNDVYQHESGVFNIINSDTRGLIPAGQVVELQYGNVVMNADGTYTYTPYDNALPEEGQLLDTFEYQLTDAEGSSLANVSIYIDCVCPEGDSVDALGNMTMLVLFLMTGLIGLYFIRKEEERA